MTARKLLFSLLLMPVSVGLMRFSGWFGLGFVVGLVLSILYGLDYADELRRRGKRNLGQNVLLSLLSLPHLLLALLAIGTGITLAVWVFYNIFIERKPEYSGGIFGWFVIPVWLSFGWSQLRRLFAAPAQPAAQPAKSPAMHHRLPDNPLFAPYRDSILATLKPCVDITLTPCDTLTLWQSKLGGWPYLPKGTDYPQDVQGRPLYLLAQINFAEVPPLPDFPRQGILQFFISPFGSRKHLWGLEDKYPDRQDYFRVLYYPEVCTDPAAMVEDFAFVSAPPVKPKPTNLLQKLGSLFTNPGPHLPFDHPCVMHFTAGEQLTTLEESGLHFYGNGVPDANADNWCDVLEDDFTDAYFEVADGEGHRLGGYAHHVQGNLRCVKNSPYRDYVLLLQLNSDEANGMMWGDLGVCHFFIHPDDLRRCDFSKVLYNWECY